MTTRNVPTKEQVLEAAKKCPEVKETLEILFPEDFKGNLKVQQGLICCSGNIPYLISCKSDDSQSFMAIQLSSGWSTSPHPAEWVIATFDDKILAPGTQIILTIGENGLVDRSIIKKP